MRIGIVCPYSLDVPGGVQHHVCELAEALIGLGEQVSVLAPADDPGLGAGLPAYVVPAGRAVPVPYNGSIARLSFGPGSVARVRRWLADQDLDVLHVHEPTAPSLSLLALWAGEVPTVATFHTSMPGGSRAMAVVGGVLRPALEKIVARIAVSPYALTTMQDHVGGDGVVIPNGVWTSAFDGVEPDPAWRTPAMSSGGTVAFLGRLEEPRKGLDVLLAAWPDVAVSHPASRLLVAGHGDVNRVRRWVRDRLGALEATVEVVGTVDPAARARLLASADVFVAPHLGGESFGIVLVEAMATGTAVLASDLPAFTSRLDGGRLGRLFPAGDPVALASGVLYLLDHPAARDVLAQRGRRASRAYDWSVVASRVRRVYQTVRVTGGVAGGTTALRSAGGR